MEHRGNEVDVGYSDFTEIATPGSNPPSGQLRFYSKSDHNFYQKTSAGVEVQIGAGTKIISATSTTSDTQVITGNAETLLPNCTLTLSSFGSNIAIFFTVNASMNDSNHAKAGSLKIRRTNISGVILASIDFAGIGAIDSSAGNISSVSGLFPDASPTNGSYVLTFAPGASDSGTCQVWSNYITFALMG